MKKRETRTGDSEQHPAPRLAPYRGTSAMTRTGLPDPPSIFIGSATMPPFERLDVGDAEPVVHVARRAVAHVDHDRPSDEPLEWHLVGGEPVLGEVNGRVEMCTAVLGRGEGIGGIEPAPRSRSV